MEIANPGLEGTRNSPSLEAGDRLGGAEIQPSAEGARQGAVMG